MVVGSRSPAKKITKPKEDHPLEYEHLDQLCVSLCSLTPAPARFRAALPTLSHTIQ
jgi:hypothetical protein